MPKISLKFAYLPGLQKQIKIVEITATFRIIIVFSLQQSINIIVCAAKKNFNLSEQTESFIKFDLNKLNTVFLVIYPRHWHLDKLPVLAQDRH